MSTTTPTSRPVIKPLVRRPSLIRKREGFEDKTPSSLGKRPMVSFDSNVEVRVIRDWEKAPQLIQEEVRCALEQHALGDPSDYNQVKDIYAAKSKVEDEPSTSTLQNYTQALLGNVSLLNKSCSSLVYAVLESQWLGRQDSYFTLYVRFLANLASAQGVFVVDVLRMLVANLTAVIPSSSRLPGSPVVPRSKIYLRVHEVLQYLLQLIPSASSILCSVLIDAFPHQTDSRRAHAIYVQNVLKTLAYAPELQAEALALITERLVKIDVQVQVDLEDLTEDVGDGLVQKIPRIRNDFAEIMDDSESSDDESVFSNDTDNEEAQRTKDIKSNVEKMDIILDLLFAYYSQLIPAASTDHRLGALDILLSQFVNIILPTHRSRHTQFLLFHFSQQSPIFIDTFVGTCVQLAFDKVQPAIMRQAAAAYLASFVARGAHVPSNIVRDVFSFIGAELERLRSAHEPTCRGPDLRRYSTFYFLVQALLYIFCFRWRDLQYCLEDSSDDSEFEDEDEDLPVIYANGRGHGWRSGVKDILATNIFCKLNPLKICFPAIVTEFARIANHLGVVYVFHLIETNKRVRLSQFAGSSASRSSLRYGQPERESALSARRDNESHLLLDGFFPFDPYHLPVSKRWISDDYREWRGVPGLDDQDDGGKTRRGPEEDEEESEAEEDLDMDDGQES
ncbi:hypothetical protein MMC07_001891 [Pseudocyphellaria aurata]|nr:hypothetical protein [Pseudocyphellaria aurata]